MCWLIVSCVVVATATLVKPSVAQKADLEFGRYLASECLTCHGSATVAGAIPNIFGLQEATFAALLKAYRDKQLPNPVMQTVASRLNDEEINALAHFFAVTKKP
jgi:cytochrome c